MSFNKIPVGRYGLFILLAIGVVLFFLEIRSIATHIGSDYRIFFNAVTRFNADPLTLYTASSVHTLQGFLYPPPAIILFLPFAALPVEASYKLFVVLLYCAAFAAMAIWVRISMSENRYRLASRLEIANVMLLTAVSGPFFAAVVAGQVDILVLLLCTVHIALITTDRPMWAGLVLAIGFWIKIYPLVLLAYALSHPKGARVLLGFICAGLALPLVLAPLVPLELYALYFMDYLPALSGSTIANIYNQSLTAFLTRLSLSVGESVQSFQAFPVPAPLRFSITVVAMFIIGLICVTAKRARDLRLPAFAMILAIFAVIAPLGWGHTYVYICPLVYFVWLIGRKLQHPLTFFLLASLYAVMLVPAYRIFPIHPDVPELAYKVFYSRYLFATVFLLIMSAVLLRFTKLITANLA